MKISIKQFFIIAGLLFLLAPFSGALAETNCQEVCDDICSFPPCDNFMTCDSDCMGGCNDQTDEVALANSMESLCQSTGAAFHCFCYQNDGGCIDITSVIEEECNNECVYNNNGATAEPVYETDADYTEAKEQCAHEEDIQEIVSPTLEEADIEPEKTFIAPKLHVEIPGFSFDNVSADFTNTNTFAFDFLGEYIAAIYNYAVGVGLIVAVVMIMWGGVRWILGSATGQIGEARKIIGKAVLGFFLLIGSYLILYVISPSLTVFQPQEIAVPETIPFTFSVEEYEPVFDPTLGKLASTKEELQEWCDTVCGGTGSGITCDIEKLREKVPELITSGMVKPEEMVDVPTDYPNLLANPGYLIAPQALEKLKRAADIAGEQKLQLVLKSAYRPLFNQLQIACERIDEVPSGVAWPGSSNHGTGYAVDLKYSTCNSQTSCLSWPGVNYYSQCNLSNSQARNVATLAKIMYEAGFQRYNKELWHYEARPSSSDCVSKKNSECLLVTQDCDCQNSCLK